MFFVFHYLIFLQFTSLGMFQSSAKRNSLTYWYQHMVKSNVRHVFSSFAKYSTGKRIFFSLPIAYIILVCFGGREPLMRKVGIPGRPAIVQRTRHAATCSEIESGKMLNKQNSENEGLGCCDTTCNPTVGIEAERT